MTVDPGVIPGLMLLAVQLIVLAAVGYVVVRVALRQADERMALAQGLVVGLALWGLITNFVLYVVPGLTGAALGWGVTVALGAALAWRTRHAISLHPRVAAGFAVAFLVIFWLALASRQSLESPDPMLHLGLAAWFRAGGFPPELPWNPGMVVRYHHAADLLVGLLTPPTGPDLAFVQELLGAYAWTSLALVVVTALMRRGSWTVALLISPLWLTAGAWTWTSLGGGILQGPVPAGLPAAGLGASLADIYWPSAESSGALEPAALHDIWTPAFTLGYALAFVVLERAARSERLPWLGVLTLGVLVGFIGILATSLVPVVVVLWAALAAAQVIRSRCAGAALRSGLGLALAGLLLLGGGGAFTAILDGAVTSGLELAWDLNPRHWEALGTFDAQPGGVGVLGLGPVVVAGIAVLLTRRDRLVVTLAAGAGLLVLAWLVLGFPPAPWVISRLAGHARNLALVALLLALAGFLSERFAKPRRRSRDGRRLPNPSVIPAEAGIQSPSEPDHRWRRACPASTESCKVLRRRESRIHPPWSRPRFSPGIPGPTASCQRLPLRPGVGSLAIRARRTARRADRLADGGGARAQSRASRWERRAAGQRRMGGAGVPLDRNVAESTQRFQLPTMSNRLGSYLRDNTPVDARVFTPEWPYWAVSLATGRPNNAGFAGFGHLIYYTGPEYLDALNFLEPAAIQRLGIEVVHATNTWAAGLPPEAQRWLADPGLFELLGHDGDEALYRVRPAFLNLEVAPHPESFEALRSVPPSTMVYLAPQLGWLHGLRIASVLAHAQLTGAIDMQPLHLTTPTPWTVEPLGERVPDLVVLPVPVEPSMFPSVEWQLVWTDAADGIAVYAPASSRSRATNESCLTVTACRVIG